MATDLDVTTAAWGTENVEPETDTTANPVYRTQVTRNTGYNFYRPELVCSQIATADDASITEKTYMAAGTYVAYCNGSKHIDTAGTASVSLDGTTLFFNTTPGAAWEGSNADVIITTTGWIDAVYLHNDTGGGGSFKYNTIHVRQKG